MCGFVGFVGEVEDREQVLTNMMNTIVQMEEKGLSSELAQIEAFYANKKG